MLHVLGNLAEAFDAAAALRRHVVLGVGHGDPRHAEQEAGIDAVVAGLDAVAGPDAAAGPFARGRGSGAEPQNVDDALDDLDRALALFDAPPGRGGDRGDL